MNDITIFNHLGNNIRVMTDEQGEPLFVLKDVCNALGITNTRNVSARLDEDMKGVRPVDTLGGTQQLTVITEPGLYEGNNVRTLTTEDDELRFALADLAAVLDITNVTQLRSRLSDDLCQTYPVPDRRGQVQQTWTVDEPRLHPQTRHVRDGEPWFVASDVAGILGYRDAYNMTRRPDPD
jgi:prophage antirepressor-like protein|nr:MAG TPA: hypothetical protein [Caudoviricetes sp.]